MQQAVNHIKNLENNIKELEIKRKKLEDLVLCSSKEDKHFGDYVKINLCDCGVEILINERIPLSRVLEELVKRQLNVVSCVSTKVDERLLHRIQIEVYVRMSISFKSLNSLIDHTYILHVPDKRV